MLCSTTDDLRLVSSCGFLSMSPTVTVHASTSPQSACRTESGRPMTRSLTQTCKPAESASSAATGCPSNAEGRSRRVARASRSALSSSETQPFASTHSCSLSVSPVMVSRRFGNSSRRFFATSTAKLWPFMGSFRASNKRWFFPRETLFGDPDNRYGLPTISTSPTTGSSRSCHAEDRTTGCVLGREKTAFIRCVRTGPTLDSHVSN